MYISQDRRCPSPVNQIMSSTSCVLATYVERRYLVKARLLFENGRMTALHRSRRQRIDRKCNHKILRLVCNKPLDPGTLESSSIVAPRSRPLFSLSVFVGNSILHCIVCFVSINWYTEPKLRLTFPTHPLRCARADFEWT